MGIYIDDSRVIKDLQAEFNNLFPFLKIEFLSKNHQLYEMVRYFAGRVHLTGEHI
jgi:hypothetical protein